MQSKLIWIIFSVITFFIGFVLLNNDLQQAGDIVEYFGITESIKNHLGINLTNQDQENLEKILHSAYFQNPGYYIKGVDGNRYPVHFIFYSVLSLPARITLDFFKLNPLNSLPLTNLIIFSAVNFVVLKWFIKTTFKRIIFLIVVYSSPLLWFLSWPGPDIYFISFLLLAIYFFYSKKYLISTILTILSSWHSQPLLVLALGLIIYYAFTNIRKRVTTSLALVMLLIFPYLLNMLMFGTLTPWTILKDGWTQIYGFGIHNASFKKIYEQFFDLNIGLFWYAPIILTLGFYSLFKHLRTHKQSLFVLFAAITTTFLYQTNPAWHYGTASYGPTRHILFIVPFLIFFAVDYFKPKINHLSMLGLLIVSQLFILSMNNFLTPNFMNTLQNSPYALFALNNFPGLYNPTPEIFVDRTNHKDLDYPTSAIYKYNGVCKKAYILKTDTEKLKKECGFIPKSYEEKLDFEGLYVDY